MNGEVAAGGRVQSQRDVAGFKNFAHLRFDDIARQAVFRDAEIQHSARDRRGLEDRDRIAHQREVMCCRQSDGTAANDRDFVRELLAPASWWVQPDAAIQDHAAR